MNVQIAVEECSDVLIRQSDIENNPVIQVLL